MRKGSIPDPDRKVPLKGPACRFHSLGRTLQRVSPQAPACLPASQREQNVAVFTVLRPIQ